MSTPSTWQWCIDRWQEVPAGYGRVVQAGIAEVQLLSLPAGVLAMSDQALLFHGDPEYQASSAEASDRQPGRSACECPPSACNRCLLDWQTLRAGGTHTPSAAQGRSDPWACSGCMQAMQ